MAASNIFTIGIALQSGKGVPATAPQWLTKARSSDLMPGRATDRIEETGTGRDGGERYTTKISVGGGAETVLRHDIAVLFLYGLLGAKSSVPPVAPETRTSHLITPANDQPYFTIWRFLGDVLFERFDDCKFVAGTFAGQAGQNITASMTIKGLVPRRLASKPVGGVLDTSFPFRVPEAVYTVEGVSNDAIREWSLQIAADQNEIQTNKITDSFLEPGLRTIEMNYTELFQDLDRYNKTLYGTAAGTQVSEDLYHNAWQGVFTDRATGNKLTLSIPNLAYMAAPLTPDPGGDPLQMQITGAADAPASGDIITAEVLNGTASYPVAV